MTLGKAGADRQEMHERLRGLTMQAWDDLRNEKPNPLLELVVTDPVFLHYISAKHLRALMDARTHVGDAPIRSKALSEQICEYVGS